MRALLAQLDSTAGALAANHARLIGALARRHDVDLAVFPELFLCGYAPAQAAFSACALDGEELGAIGAAAAAHGTAVVVGFAESIAGGGVANAAACFDRDGSLAGVYRKTHLFGEGEREAFAAGEELLVVELAGRHVGVEICFDVEFPEPARALALDGAELFVTIAANMSPYGPDHDLLVRARALENRRAHLYVNRVGRSAGLEFVGGSCAVDRRGQVVLAAGEAERLVTVEVPTATGAEVEDVDYLRHIRGELPVRTGALHIGEGGARR